MQLFLIISISLICALLLGCALLLYTMVKGVDQLLTVQTTIFGGQADWAQSIIDYLYDENLRKKPTQADLKKQAEEMSDKQSEDFLKNGEKILKELQNKSKKKVDK